MTDVPYRFHIRIGNFQFEVEGERGFVERTITRYEGRYLPKFQQLLDKIPAIEPTLKPAITQQPPITQQPAITQVESKPSIALRPETPPEKERPRDYDQKDKRRFGKQDGRRRNDRRRGNNRSGPTGISRVMPAPILPHDQEVIKHPYMPPDGFDIQALPDEEISPPVPLRDRIGEEMQKAESPEVVRELAVVTDEDLEDEPGIVLEGDQSEESLKRFFETLKARTHHEKIMVFGYFLQVKRGMKEFGTGKIKSCYDAVGTDAAGNINQVLNHACRTGFATKFQRGRSVKYSLTSKGKQFVERGLQGA